MDISKADLVISLAGRDKGSLLYVLEAEETGVLVVDGKKRKLENPKRKKLKHVRKIQGTLSGSAAKLLNGEKVLNSELRRDLAIIGQTFRSQNQGGSETWQKTT